MQQLTGFRIVRAIVLAGLVAATLGTHVFLSIDRVRAKIVDAPVTADAGSVRVSTAGYAQARNLRPPFALIARVDTGGASGGTLSLTVDGAPVCEQPVAGGSQRIDCTVGGEWSPGAEHTVVMQGPSSPWRLESLELATFNGHTNGIHSLIVLPAASNHYERPSLLWVIVTLVLVAVVLLFPAPARLPRWLGLAHAVIAGAIALEFAAIVVSERISAYRLVLAAETFATWVVVLCAPWLWSASGALARRAAVNAGVAPAAQRAVIPAIAIVVFLAALIGGPQFARQQSEVRAAASQLAAANDVRQVLHAELQPVTLKNCDLKRYGGSNDGGYLMCDNLVEGPESGYSYGISGEDNWGCDLSRKTGIPIHQYDCFDVRQPVCDRGRFVFHAECIGGTAATIDSRPFDSLTNQIARNGDAGKPLIVKIDVEGAEWESVLATPDEVLDRIAQMPMELHGTDEWRFVEMVRKLKRTFHLVHIHYNNHACRSTMRPFPAFAYQVLFVNKRLGVLDPSAPPPTLPNPADAPDHPDAPDCQRAGR